MTQTSPSPHRIRRLATAALILPLMISAAPAEIMLQWFETEWDEMYQRLPVTAEIGYDFLWIPPPTKAPTGKGTKWSNVGYSLYDRFDLGDIPQRGSVATRYGTRGSLRNMVDQAHQLDLKIIPDIVMNHNGNGPDFRTYPGMTPEDFHLHWQQGYYNTLNYSRAPQMYQWYHAEGYGGTMWQDLANLIDIRTEDHPLNPDALRFTGVRWRDGNQDGDTNDGDEWSFDFVGSRPNYIRHVGQPDKYPYYPAGYTNELASEMLFRWITWLGNAIDYDGLRLDAAKHTPWEFFGTRGNGFLHEAQWNYNQRRGFSDGNPSESDHLFRNDVVRDDALIFAEILSHQGELNYWYGDLGTKNNTRNPMRFLDYPIHQKALEALNGGELSKLTLGGGGLDPEVGVLYIWGHDDDHPDKRPHKAVLAYAYLFTHVGLPMLYTTGNNLAWSDSGRSAYPNSRTWMVPGFDSHAFGKDSDDIVNLAWIHRNFARGREWERWAENDFFAYERYEDKNGNANPNTGEGIMLVALNDSGVDQTRNNVTVSFPVGTVLKDYTGNNLSEITVYNNGGASQVNVTVPANGGQGYVCYAPKIAEPVSLTFRASGAPVPTMTWIVPGGEYGTAQTKQLPRITTTNFTVDVAFTPAGGAVDSVMVRWGQGKQRLSTANYWETNDIGLVAAGYESANPLNATNWSLAVAHGASLPEGLNVVRARVFNQRPADQSALFNTETKVVYVDLRGPDLDVAWPTEGATITGDAVLEIRNPDFSAYGMLVGVDGITNTAHEIMKGTWKYALAGLAPGPHTLTITATEADYGNPRMIINSSILTRNFTVAANPNPVTLSHADGTTLELPFFKTTVTAPGATNAKLYWDGYELPFNDGGLTNTFNGEIVRRDHLGNVANERLWGNFVNGQHFFEAVRVDGGVTSRAVARVAFNLYGVNAIDSDGDSLPDNVEVPDYDDGAPGGDQPLKGDHNKDSIPKDENWETLNPLNHSTFYIGSWDDRLDSDNDGYLNGEEVLAGYNEDGNINKYSIFNAASHPTGTSNNAASVTWAPNPVPLGQTLTIQYTPNQGPLATATQIVLHIGHSAATAGSWQGVADVPMTFVGPHWTYGYAVPANATSVDFVFNDGGATWDNNGGADWHAQVQGSTNRYFTMNGSFDGNDYVIIPGGAGRMEVRAAVRNGSLYVATHAAGGGGSDHFVYVTDTLGDASNPAPGWNKPGNVFMNTGGKPWIAAEGANGFSTWNHAPGAVIANSGQALEGELSLQNVFGYIPTQLFVAAVAYQSNDGGILVAQGPPAWGTMDNNIMPMELQRVPLASIRDDDLDGYFDGGNPQLWTVVNGNTNDANYALRRFFLNELAGDTATMTVLLRPNAGGTNQVTHVELFSNINRRDFAVLEEDPSDVTAASVDTYFRAYPMQDLGGGLFGYTVTLTKCGAYRVNARYRINGGPYVYYTDHGLRRDCAVVVSPTKALNLSMYELNPMVAEATSDQKSGRSTFADMYQSNTNKPDRINTNHFVGLGVNMIWLQPIHPIGTVGRETDPATGQPYEPGSPYAVKNYWKVNGVLGADDTSAGALAEFQDFVSALDGVGVGVMLDGTFNHSAWDCEVGEVGVDMGIAPDAAQEIRNARPQWYSKKDRYGEQATVDWEIAPAPDRIDFGKWADAADFHFGRYDALVQFTAANTNNAWSSPWYHQYLSEVDQFDGHNAYTRELWEYFARYPLFWLEQTGHPAGTPPAESHRGIDGLRCDFAQGLPSLFWEYCINKTRSVKWDFLFMAESLDGYATVAGSNRHGVGFRSARHFDILNENLVFYWRNDFFDYFKEDTPQPLTAPTRTAYDQRRQAFDASPLLLNLTSHDEVYPSHDPYRLLYAHAQLAALDGVPMLFYGQEAGAQNDTAVYNNGGEIPNSLHNFARYEVNFGKSIPNFKRYNAMTNVWNNRDWTLQALYGRLNLARLTSPALRSQGVYFLERTDNSAPDPDMFAIAKFESPGLSASTQDVVFAFVNNNYWASENRTATFKLNPTLPDGRNWFGIEAAKQYNIVNLFATNPAAYIWNPNKSGAELIADGIFVGLNQPALQGGQAQFLKLVDVNAAYPDADADGDPDFSDWDDDNDSLPDAWEQQYGLNPNNNLGDEGAGGDKDNDGITNHDEYLSGTNPDDPGDRLEVESMVSAGASAQIQWSTKPGRDYRLDYTTDLLPPQSWSPAYGYVTALTNAQSYAYPIPINASNGFFRVNVR